MEKLERNWRDRKRREQEFEGRVLPGQRLPSESQPVFARLTSDVFTNPQRNEIYQDKGGSFPGAKMHPNFQNSEIIFHTIGVFKTSFCEIIHWVTLFSSLYLEKEQSAKL